MFSSEINVICMTTVSDPISLFIVIMINDYSDEQCYFAINTYLKVVRYNFPCPAAYARIYKLSTKHFRKVIIKTCLFTT